MRAARGRPPRGAPAARSRAVTGVLAAAAGGLAAALLAVVTMVAGCSPVPLTDPAAATSTTAAPTPTAPPPDPQLSALDTDAVTALTTRALQDYWRTEFPVLSGRPWTEITTFSPVHPTVAGAPAPPCVAHAADLRGNAFFCPAADAVVWDADGLMPQLRAQFGPPGIVVVLAHEFGHAVQTRLGIDDAQRADPARYPTILLEAMSDCYAGAALHHLADATAAGTDPSGSARLTIGPVERDAALAALVGFRDPLGTLAADTSAHGNAFDRLSAVEDGYADGAARCAAMTLDNRQFTQRRFGSAADRARGGNLPLDRLLGAVSTDSRTWFDQIVAQRTPATPPRAPVLLRTGPGADSCGAQDLQAQGPVRYCALDDTVVVDRDALTNLQSRFGDYAGATLVASRYGLAALAALGHSSSGSAAGRDAVCLAGAYTGRLVDPTGSFGLSPGDLDEAVQVLLAVDWAERDAAGGVDPADHGFERVQYFRTGFAGGPGACGI